MPDPTPVPAPPVAAAAWVEACTRLERGLARFEALAVAFSGGVDSAVLLAAAHGVLGTRALGVLADSPSLPRSELVQARELARAIGVELVVLATDEFADAGYVANDGARCYHCKSALFRAMGAWARARGVRDLAFGEITDDLLDDRPGRRAALEARVHAPLREAGFGKAEVRRWAREHGLGVWDKPASACLASRIPLGTPVTRAGLARVEAGEAALRELGLRVLRLRDHFPRARVEVGATELERARAQWPRIEALLRARGWSAAELSVYRSAAERQAD